MKYTHATIIVNLCFFGLRNGFANGCYNMPCICRLFSALLGSCLSFNCDGIQVIKIKFGRKGTFKR